MADSINITLSGTPSAEPFLPTAAEKAALVGTGTPSSLNKYVTEDTLESESLTREGAEATLQANIDTEAETRETADSTLQTNINTETTNRTSADASIQSELDDTVLGLDTEIQNRLDADQQLQSNIEQVQSNLDTEATARAQADTNLQNQIDRKADLDSNDKIPLAQLPDIAKQPTNIYNTTALMNADTSQVRGTKALVLDDGDGKNAGYIWDGSQWIKTSDASWENINLQWPNIVGKPSSTPTELDDAVTKKHTHANKALLDTYTQTEADLKNAVDLRHGKDEPNASHYTKGEMDTMLNGKTYATDTNLPEITKVGDDDTFLTFQGGVPKRLRYSNFHPPVNDIGIAGALGFGVGICNPDKLPAYLVPMTGTDDVSSNNYGNYRCVTDNSIMVYIPKFYVKITNDVNAPYNGTKVEIKRSRDFANSNEAALAGYFLPRAFIDGGVEIDGFMYDKYGWSLTNYTLNTSGIASSVLNGKPITSASSTKANVATMGGSFSDCKSNGQAPADIYGGAWAAAKSRGNDFYVTTLYQRHALSLLGLAHVQASTTNTFCAWRDVNPPQPKGNNNNALKDANDASVAYVSAGMSDYPPRALTGSGTPFAKTTHNGQNNGIADLNGNMYQIEQGLTCQAETKNITAITREAEAVFTIAAHGYLNGDRLLTTGVVSAEWGALLKDMILTVSDVTADTFKLKKAGVYINTSALSAAYVSGFTATKGTFYQLKDSVELKTVTGGNSVATDHFNFANPGLEAVDVNSILVDGVISQKWGNGTNQAFGSNPDKSTLEYKLSNLFMPKSSQAISTGGTTMLGNDYFYQYIRNELCVLAGGSWIYSPVAGVRCVYLVDSRTNTHYTVSGRSALSIK